MKDGKVAVVESEAERVRLIFRRYLKLSGVNALVRDLEERNIRTKARLLSTGATRGGIPFERGTLFYLLRNRFYIGEVRYKGEILPGEQPPIMERALFDAVQQKLTDQWTTRTSIRNAADHLLAGLLFDDAGHRMAPTHATKAGIRYRYYVSLPCLHLQASIVEPPPTATRRSAPTARALFAAPTMLSRGECGRMSKYAPAIRGPRACEMLVRSGEPRTDGDANTNKRAQPERFTSASSASAAGFP
jgi:hypothetical protein